jgi:hypothetical protein
MRAKRPHLVMVYNADGGLFSALGDAAHKLLSPATYPCSLCAITYGAARMKREWRDYLARLGAEITFHHRDDFAAAWPDARFAFPVILMKADGQLAELVTARALDAIRDVAQLTALIDRV